MFKTTGDFETEYEKLHQGWHMQRALLEKQNIEIDRLKNAQKRMQIIIDAYEKSTTILDIKIERLRKERDWLISQCQKLEEIMYDYDGVRPKELIVEQMQQALKDK